jgi:hypothetical protein
MWSFKISCEFEVEDEIVSLRNKKSAKTPRQGKGNCKFKACH